MLTELLRETEKHHGEYEPTAPKPHWSGWYAAYIVARQNGKTPEEAAKEGKLRIEGALAARSPSTLSSSRRARQARPWRRGCADAGKTIASRAYEKSETQG